MPGYSIEEKTEEYCKKKLDEYGIRHYGKTEPVNAALQAALKNAASKSGGSGNNYPDIQLLLTNRNRRSIPVMIEAKGSKKKLEKLTKDGRIELVTVGKDGKENHRAVTGYAVNGAVHYAQAVLDEGTYKEVIAIGINGTELNADGSVKDPECRAYYISVRNNCVPKHIPELDHGWKLLKAENLDRLYGILDQMSLREQEVETLTRRTEATLEEKVKAIHQSLYDDERLRVVLTTNEKLYLFCGLIMAGLTTDGLAELTAEKLEGNDDSEANDATVIISRIRAFLKKKKCSEEKIKSYRAGRLCADRRRRKNS